MPARVKQLSEVQDNDEKQRLTGSAYREQNRRFDFVFHTDAHDDGTVSVLACGVKGVWIDAMLAFFSLSVLFYAIVSISNDPSPVVQTWDSIVVFDKDKESAKHGLSRELREDFKTDLQEWCGGGNNSMQRLVITSMYNTPAFPVALWSDQTVNLWFLMVPVILITFTAQVYRFVTRKWPNGTVAQFLGTYTPRSGPDLGRWVEYMLTSPLQIVIVALSFHFRERAVLLCLGTMQAVLVVMGYSIEKEIEHQAESGAGKTGLAVLYGASCFMHIVIWVVLGQRWDFERGVYKECTGGGDMKKMEEIINGIFISQAVLFSVFGLVPLYTYMNRMQPLVWEHTAYVYSILSVVAKTTLLFYFVAYVSRSEFIFTDLAPRNASWVRNCTAHECLKYATNCSVNGTWS